MNDDEPTLAPPQGIDVHRLQAAEARQVLFRALSRPAPEKPRFQYSLAELAALSSFLAVVMALAHYLPLKAFAAAVGVATVLAMACEHLAPGWRGWFTWAWSILSIVYLVSLIAAVVRG
jgi:hypothetical protein